ALPQAQAAGPISMTLREIVINVDAQGGIIVSGRTVTPEQLLARIAEAVKLNPEQKVTVRGDRSAAYAAVVRALDVCKAAGIQEPYLDTVLAAPGGAGP
ncbi:MAG TPA: biopolymer transporter ExbD, partial [Phycisphaerae bacterium]|nr:biopolymer transporter ExbD [Phycisphaerae bacterium]